MPYPSMADNPWGGFLEDNPELAYAAMRPQGGGKTFLDYWKNAYKDIWSQYEGRLGQQALMGQAPSTNWTDYLQQYPWLQRYMAQSPQARGDSRANAYSPELRWIY